MQATLQLGRHFKHLEQKTMITAYNEVNPKAIRNLPGADACDPEILSVERSRPGCSLHQGASLWNDAPAGAVPGQNTKLGFTSLNIGPLLPTTFDKSIQ